MTPDRWIDDVIGRHAESMPRPQFLKAVRALSARYVERRRGLARDTATDSAGKRAAFAGFYSPLHFLTLRQVLAASHAPAVRSVLDLGCGTGVAGAAWALRSSPPARVAGIDLNAWALAEARQNWRQLGLTGRASSGNMVTAIEKLVQRAGPLHDLGDRGVIFGWSLNELDQAGRRRVSAALLRLARHGMRILIVEPISRRTSPWWPDVAAPAVAAGGRADEWRFDADLPRALALISRDAGFSRDELTARTIAMNF
jgi:SAM-dependent methyltransferase